jgi:hypothetical protein
MPIKANVAWNVHWSNANAFWVQALPFLTSIVKQLSSQNPTRAKICSPEIIMGVQEQLFPSNGKACGWFVTKSQTCTMKLNYALAA